MGPDPNGACERQGGEGAKGCFEGTYDRGLLPPGCFWTCSRKATGNAGAVLFMEHLLRKVTGKERL